MTFIDIKNYQMCEFSGYHGFCSKRREKMIGKL